MFGLKEKFLEYLSSLDCDFIGRKGMVDLFYECYMERKPLDKDEEIQERFKQIDAALKDLPLEDNNQIFQILMDQCLRYCEVGFFAGFEIAVKFIGEAKFWLEKE